MKKQMRLSDLPDEIRICSGATLRIYGVNRMDVMKRSEDWNNPKKLAKDYYDMLVFDSSTVEKGTFMIVNITTNCRHIGHIYAILNITDKYVITAGVLKKYFEKADVYVLKAKFDEKGEIGKLWPNWK